MYLTVNEYERDYYLSGNPLPEYLVEMAQKGEDMPDSLGDIHAGFPDEDFLDEPIKDLAALIRNTHKNNKLLPALEVILATLREKQDESRRNVEYGMEEIKKIEALLRIF